MEDLSQAPVNVYEAGGQVSVAVPVPGARPEHIIIEVERDQIRIHARSTYPQQVQHYHFRGWQVGQWSAATDLPHSIDPATAHATLSLGVLVVMAQVGDSPPASALTIHPTDARERSHQG